MRDPAFLFYPNDYLGGTMGMTFEEKGAYMELLMLQFNRGHMTSHMAGQVVGQLWDNIKCKFKIDDQGLYYNERLEIEVQKRKAYVQTRSNNLTGINQYTKKGGHMDGHMDGHLTSHMENRNRDRNIDRTKRKNKKNTDRDDDRKPYGEFQNVLLTDEEFDKLYVRRSEYIERLSKYIKSSGKKYKNHYATILTWMDKDGVQNIKPEPKPEVVRNPVMDERMRNLVNQLRTDHPG